MVLYHARILTSAECKTVCNGKQSTICNPPSVAARLATVVFPVNWRMAVTWAAKSSVQVRWRESKILTSPTLQPTLLTTTQWFPQIFIICTNPWVGAGRGVSRAREVVERRPPTWGYWTLKSAMAWSMAGSSNWGWSSITLMLFTLSLSDARTGLPDWTPEMITSLSWETHKTVTG